MQRLIKGFARSLFCLLLILISSLFVGCKPVDSGAGETYEYIFSVTDGTDDLTFFVQDDELHTQWRYDGKEHTYSGQYRFFEHPDYAWQYFTDAIESTLVYIDETGAQIPVSTICDTGEYVYTFTVNKGKADLPIKNWNTRTLRLHVSVLDSIHNVSDNNLQYQSFYVPAYSVIPYSTARNGEKLFSFKPEWNGYYAVSSGHEEVYISFNGQRTEQSSAVQWLVKGQEYLIEVYSQQQVQGFMTIDIADFKEYSPTVQASQPCITKYCAEQDGVYEITAQNAYIAVFKNDVYKSPVNSAYDVDKLHVYLSKDKTYYVVCENITPTQGSNAIGVEPVSLQTVTLEKSATVIKKAGEAAYFRLEIKEENRYRIYVENYNTSALQLYTSTGEIVRRSNGVGMQSAVCLPENPLPAGTYYLGTEANELEGEITCLLVVHQTNYYWKVNGQVYNGEGLARGEEYVIEVYDENDQLYMPIDGFKYDDYYGIQVKEVNATNIKLEVLDDALMMDDRIIFPYFDVRMQYSRVSLYSIYQRKEIEVELVSNAQTGEQSLQFNVLLGENQYVDVILRYEIGNGETYWQETVRLSADNLNCALNKRCASVAETKGATVVVEQMRFTDQNGNNWGRVYNGYLSDYAEKNNQVNIPPIEIGVKN